ncbi:MAG: EAL domain-containing protein [Deltaproteobacteria bacterium]|nr:EAL domain-containing protein [Deltaproteobacteria bacterium]
MRHVFIKNAIYTIISVFLLFALFFALAYASLDAQARQHGLWAIVEPHFYMLPTFISAAVIIILINVFSCGRATSRVRALAEAAGKIASGGLNAPVPVNGNDEIASLATAFNAITANVKEKNTAIVASEARLRSLVNNMPDCLWTIDETGRVTAISPMALNISGYTVHEFLNSPGIMFDNIHPDDIKTVKQAYQALISDNGMFSLEYRFKKKSGDWVWLHNKAFMTYAKAGHKYAEGIFSDITSRKAAELALLDSEARLNGAQRIAHLGSWDWNVAQNTLRWSDEVFRIFGLNPRSFGATYEAFISSVHPDDAQMVKDAVDAALHGKKPYSINHRILLPGGKTRYVHEVANVQYASNGEPVRMFGTVQDVTDQVEAERKLANLAKFPLENPYPVLRTTHDGILIYANPAAQNLFAGEGLIPGAPLSNYWRRLVTEAATADKQMEFEVNHGERFFSYILTPVHGEQYVNVYGRDVTENKKADIELKKLHLAMEQSVNIVFITDIKGHIEYVNPMFESVTGYSRDEAIGQTPRILSSGDVPQEKYDQLWQTITSGKTWRDTYKNRKKNGAFYWCSTVISPVRDASGAITHFLAVQEDLTEKMASEERLQHLARHDELTSLVNRARFMELIAEWIVAEGPEGHGALLLIDVDHFKYVNDTYGHATGDEILSSMASLFQSALEAEYKAVVAQTGSNPMLGRMSGDEFAIFLPHLSEAEALKIAERLRKDVEASRTLQGSHAFSVNVSAGMVMYPEHAQDAKTFFTRADVAMYRAKELGRNRIHVYSPDDKDIEKINSRFKWKERILKALEEDGFVPWFQPILDLSDNHVHHFEALARMTTADGEVLLPGAFIDVAERFELVGNIDRMIIEKTMRMQAKGGAGAFAFSMNLSGKDLGDADLLRFIQAKIETTGADPRNLIFEITETAAIRDIVAAKKFVHALKGMGCKFSLDDFGVGFTSFSYLKALSMDYIKIDGSFIMNLHKDASDQVFVKAMTGLAKGLGIKTVAEFVGDERVLKLLKEYGVDYAQGYLIGKPLPEALAASASISSE